MLGQTQLMMSPMYVFVPAVYALWQQGTQLLVPCAAQCVSVALPPLLEPLELPLLDPLELPLLDPLLDPLELPLLDPLLEPLELPLLDPLELPGCASPPPSSPPEPPSSPP